MVEINGAHSIHRPKYYVMVQTCFLSPRPSSSSAHIGYLRNRFQWSVAIPLDVSYEHWSSLHSGLFLSLNSVLSDCLLLHATSELLFMHKFAYFFVPIQCSFSSEYNATLPLIHFTPFELITASKTSQSIKRVANMKSGKYDQLFLSIIAVHGGWDDR